MTFVKTPWLAVALSLFTSSAAIADNVISDDLIVIGEACIGPGCEDGEDFSGATPLVKLKGTLAAIDFIDQNESATLSETDWRIQANETVLEQFMIKNTSAGTTPFTISEFAASDTLYLHAGQVGINTSLPQDNLHVVAFGGDVAGIILDSPLVPNKWKLEANSLGMTMFDANTANIQFSISDGAPDRSMRIASNGNVGLGVFPEGKLHTKGDGVQLAYFESGDGGPVQVRFRTDSENRRFLAVNNAKEVKTQLIFLDDRINFTGQTDSGANLWLSIGPNGITSQGPTCSSPCDLTFDPEVFTVPAIEDRAAYMWENMHLPAIGPTSPDTPINLTEKTGGIIHELEVAHIYIERLNAEISSMQSAHADAMEAQDARLARQEAEIARLSAALSQLVQAQP